MEKMIYGVAINDANYNVSLAVDGKTVWVCPFYRKWFSMIVRCYSENHQKKARTYSGCYVCKEWLRFSVFKEWMELQDWEGNELDKDIIKEGNKVYCEEFCAFVTKGTNLFISENKSSKGAYKTGVSLHKKTGKLRATCRNPFTDRCEHLGLFSNEEDAHKAWKLRKLQIAKLLAECQSDARVSNALIAKYSGS